ncbi:unnamed protein product [Arabis nemorensis]|uniref:Uncharacterized protein n=1 Tax=Arabis nemorensis TaxID=586526 RepID=A0A565BML5_9BRAS|nr:unnamed protein product [Arabis nemorensis]
MAETLGEVLANVPREILPALEKIITLIDPQFLSLVADVLSIVPHDILLGIIRSKPDSKVRIIEYIENED